MNKPKILIVDDDARISKLLHVLLEKAFGYEVREENRSFAALAAARMFRPDLVLLDVDMPGKSGGEVAADLAADTGLCNTPVVFVTSLLPQSESGNKASIRGGKYFLSKPVDPVVLLRTVRTVLHQTTAPAAA